MFKRVNYFKKLSLLGIVTLILMLSNKANSITSIPGQECQPSSVQQVEDLLFLSYTPNGITNTSPIGGKTFFVVCPLNVDEDENSLTTVGVEVEYLSNAANTISCALYETDVQGSGNANNESASNFPSLTFTASGLFPKSVKVSYNPSHGYFNGDDSMSVVCALPPQSRIGHLFINGT